MLGILKLWATLLNTTESKTAQKERPEGLDES